VSNVDSLIPPGKEAAARSDKRMSVAFGYRFFLLLLIGLIWLAPAFVQYRFVYAMLAWDGLVVLAWIADLVSLPKAEKLKIRRTWKAPVALSVFSEIELTLINESARSVHANVLDTIPAQLRSAPPEVEIIAGARNEGIATYSVRPVRRGPAKIGDAYLRYQSPMHIAEKWAKVALEETVQVYPDLDEAKKHSIYLMRSRQIEMEKRHARVRGIGREFESLREYRQGDEYRDICWTAAARRGKLVTRIYQIERSQVVWIVIDSGRLMRARVGALSKLDYAANAALSLAQVALYSGDCVGLITYGRGIRQRLPAAKGSAHLRQMIEQLALMREETGEADHLQTASKLFSDQKRRSLIIWLTDLAETSMTPEVVDAASLMMPRHLVLFVAIGQPDLGELAATRPENEQQMFQVSAAQEMVHRRELLLARLRERGALALEVHSGSVSPVVVNSYLQIKERNQL
jgi:uncharacterized protein (DUF58 family)